MEKAQQFKPNPNLEVGGKFEGMSSYNYEYLEKGSPMKSEKIKHPDNDIMPRGAF